MVPAMPMISAIQKPRLSWKCAIRKAPSRISEPCMKLTTSVDLKMITKPRAMSA